MHNTQFHWVGRGNRGHAYLIENERTSQDGPTGDKRITRGLPTKWGWIQEKIDRDNKQQ